MFIAKLPYHAILSTSVLLAKNLEVSLSKKTKPEAGSSIMVSVSMGGH